MSAVRLKTLLGDHAITLPLKRGEVTSPKVKLDFADVRVPNTAFKRVVRDLEFDVAELAIVTFLMAKAQGKPLTLLPAVLMARAQHPYLVYDANRGALSPRDLAGRRVGIRSWTVTTAVWIRAILANDWGVDTRAIEWITLEDAHVTGFDDPAGVVRAKSGQDVLGLLRAGEIDAAVVSSPIDDPSIKPLIPDPISAASAWQEKYRAIQINHMAVVRTALCESRPDAVREVYRLLADSKRAAGLPQPGSVDLNPFGIAQNARNLEVVIEATHQQGLIPRRFAIDELFGDVGSAFA